MACVEPQTTGEKKYLLFVYLFIGTKGHKNVDGNYKASYIFYVQLCYQKTYTILYLLKR